MKRLLLCTALLAVPLLAHATPEPPEPELALVAPGPIATVAALPTLHAMELTQAAPASSPATSLLSGVAGTAILKLLLMLVGLAASMHLGTKAWTWLLSKLHPANVHVSTNHTVNDVLNALLNGGEHLLTTAISGEKLDALLQLIATGASGPAILDFLKSTFGADIAQKLLGDLGPVGSQAALTIFGTQAAAEAKAGQSLVVAARQVATKLAQQKLTAAQVKAGLIAAAQPVGA